MMDTIKRSFFCLLLMGMCMATAGQGSAKAGGMPPFTILLTNGETLGYKNLAVNKAVLLIYFAPDCDHCREFAENLTGRMRDFKDMQVIMVSYFPLPALKAFYADFKLARFPNVKVGTEGNAFVVPAYFKIENFPFIAVFDKKGKLAASFRKVPKMDVLAGLAGKISLSR